MMHLYYCNRLSAEEAFGEVPPSGNGAASEMLRVHSDHTPRTIGGWEPRV
jgi:hypothetical protein